MRALMVCLPEYGHFHPMAPLAHALREAGHEVVFATAREFCARIEQAGFPAWPAGLSLPDQLEQARRRFPRAHAQPPGKDRFESFVPRMLGGVAAPARAKDLLGLLAEWRPDLVVHDEADFAGPVVGAAVGVPHAAHSLGPLRPLRMAQLVGEELAPLCAELGVELGPFAGLFSYLYLDVCPPSLQRPGSTDVEVAHPLRLDPFDAVGDEDLPAWVETLPDRPVVYVTLGTVFNQKAAVFRAVLDALATEPVNVIMTIGPHNDPTSVGPRAENVHVESYIPNSLLLPRCDVVIHHGGSSMLGVLREGLPLLMLPQGANQFHNAEACVETGAARQLLLEQVSVEAVRRAVRTLLDDPAYRARAGRVAGEIHAMPAPQTVVPLLERLQRERRPVYRAARRP